VANSVARSEIPTERWEALRVHLKHGLVQTLGIAIEEVQSGSVSGRMPVTEAVAQPFGALHGGAFASLAETLASIGGLAVVDFPSESVVGQNLSVHFFRPAGLGATVVGRASAVHLGRTTQVWDVQMVDSETDREYAVARVTLAVVRR
jgi:uncharacterized protein (TIGR00369 family)